jgi:hypothetical protein
MMLATSSFHPRILSSFPVPSRFLVRPQLLTR